MNKKLKHSKTASLIGYAGLALFILLVSGALFRFTLKSGFMLNVISNRIESTINKGGSELSISGISGDAWSHITLKNISYSDNYTEWQIAEAELDYSFIHVVFGDSRLNSVNIRGAKGRKKQASDDNTDQLKFSLAEASWFIEKFRIDESSFSSGQFNLEEIKVSGKAEIGAINSVSVGEFEAALINENLQDTLFISSEADFKNGLLNLNQLILKSGQTLLSTSLQLDGNEESIEGSGSGEQILLQDFISTKFDSLFNQPFEIDEISVDGSFREFQLGLKGRSANTGDFDARIKVIQDTLIRAQSMNVSLSTLKLDSPSDHLSYVESGAIDVYLDFEGQAFDIEGNDLLINKETFYSVKADGFLKEDILQSNLQIQKSKSGEYIAAELSAAGFFTTLEKWDINAQVTDLNPAWFVDENIDGSINGRFKGSGVGITPGEESWQFELSSERSELVGQPVDQLEIRANLNNEKLSLNAKADIRGSSSLELKGTSSTNAALPEYDFELLAKNINLGDITGFEGTRSNLSLIIEGEGRGIQSDDIELDIKLGLEDGTLNTGRIDDIAAEIKVEKQFIRIENAIIRSTFGDGTISAFQNYKDFSDPDNRTDFLIRVKDLNPLASVFKLQSLSASGEITGSINRTSDGFSFFKGEYELIDITLDDHLKSARATGSGEILFGEENSYSLELEVLDPELGFLAFEDFTVNTFGLVDIDSVRGRYDMRLGKEETGTIQQSGRFTFDPGNFLLESKLQQFDIQSGNEIYELTDDFNFMWSPEYFVSDTLSLSGQNDSYLWMAWEIQNEKVKQSFVKTKSLDIGQWQELLLKERVVNGSLSGEFELFRGENEITASGIAELEDPGYKSAKMEKLNALLNLENDRMDLDLIGRWDGVDKFNARLSLPFSLDDPTNFSRLYGDKPVRGELTFQDTQLNRFRDLLAFAGLETVDGRMEADFRLNGTAENPEISRGLIIREPIISGVPLDSMVSTLSYLHEREILDLQATLFARDLEVGILDAKIPFSINFENLELNVPDAGDPVNIELTTDNLDLAVLDDFVNAEFMRNIEGRADGQINLRGVFSEPIPRGDIQITNGSFDVPFSEISIRDINSSLRIDSGLIDIQQLTAQSGEGLLNVAGAVNLKGINAEVLSLQIEAEQFLISDTRDALVDITARTQLEGDISSPNLYGSVELNEGFIYSSKLGESGVETINLESDTLSLIIAKSPFYQRLNMNVDLSIGDEFSFRNRDYLTIDITDLEGEINAVKESYGDLALIGSLQSDNGYATPLGKRFELEEANFIFDGDPYNPGLYNSFVYSPTRGPRSQEQEVVIKYIIEGDLENPEYRFESEPEMARKDIIGFVLFGNPYYRLGPVEQLLVSTNSREGVDEESLDLLLSRMEQLATQAFGVDMVDVNPIQIGQERGTAVHTGWYLNDRTFFRLVNEVGANTPKTLFMLEYLINENLELILTQGNDRRQGVDLRWIFEY